jgi:hypothetical protein
VLGLLMRPVFARICQRLLDSLEQAALARAARHAELPLPQPLRRLQEDQARVQGPDHPDTLRMHNKLARWLRQVQQAAAEYRQVLEDQARVHRLRSRPPEAWAPPASLYVVTVDSSKTSNLRYCEDEITGEPF